MPDTLDNGPIDRLPNNPHALKRVIAVLLAGAAEPKASEPPAKPEIAPGGAGGLVPFEQWAERYFKKKNGERYGWRAKLNLIKRFKIPIIEVGHVRLVDPVAADDALRRNAKHQPTPNSAPRRGPGRPRAA